MRRIFTKNLDQENIRKKNERIERLKNQNPIMSFNDNNYIKIYQNKYT